MERWFLAHADGVYAFVFFRVGKDRSLATDVVQDTFTAALEKIELYEPRRGTMLAWLTYTARNCIRKALKEKQRYRQLVDRWQATNGELREASRRLDVSPLGEDVLERQETAELVQMTLSSLPRRYRNVLRDHYSRRRSLRQVAASEGLSEGAVKSLLHRARRAFKVSFRTLGAACHLPDSQENTCHE